ncbi:hypothetical protein AM1_C0091 (plasmid) [Acaryochloris marina MBIC11017]|uniref:Uncharacterized protein n=1 Tax=Acaryochloris marina (strain MBIC 11017) TaxID=329726 RepID=A8ZMI8_ACAM1|nr:hypothetical protein AM1_C0091 [Acaryochloris marina MBIC11017]
MTFLAVLRIARKVYNLRKKLWIILDKIITPGSGSLNEQMK